MNRMNRIKTLKAFLGVKPKTDVNREDWGRPIMDGLPLSVSNFVALIGAPGQDHGGWASSGRGI
jgi:hypothetical protein